MRTEHKFISHVEPQRYICMTVMKCVCSRLNSHSNYTEFACDSSAEISIHLSIQPCKAVLCIMYVDSAIIKQILVGWIFIIISACMMLLHSTHQSLQWFLAYVFMWYFPFPSVSWSHTQLVCEYCGNTYK